VPFRSVPCNFCSYSCLVCAIKTAALPAQQPRSSAPRASPSVYPQVDPRPVTATTAVPGPRAPLVPRARGGPQASARSRPARRHQPTSEPPPFPACETQDRLV
uniref:Uncharacterized protein n=1 Tax=Aegilops tauschii subsp. strangulata TaxID=200361 RepID=A0A453J0I8_AEGTS